MMMTGKIYYVYSIKVNGVVRYIGKTNNIKRREAQHRRGLKRGEGKFLYIKMRELNENEINLEIVQQCNSALLASRLECHLILADFFNKRLLWQSPPIRMLYY